MDKPQGLFKPTAVERGDAGSPESLGNALTGVGLEKALAIGNIAILNQPLVGICCSRRCPGNAIVKTYDLARELRNANVGVIGGFHSPMEQECLDLLLRGTQPIVICPARSIEKMWISTRFKDQITAGRLLILSPFSNRQSRSTSALAIQRNQFVALLSKEIIIPSISPGGQTESLCHWAIERGRRVSTLTKTEGIALEGVADLVDIPALLSRIQNW